MLTFKQHPFLKPPSDAEMAVMEPSELLELHEIYHAAIDNAKEDPIRYGFELDPWKEFDTLLDRHDEVLVLGGNRCLAGEQEIYDPVTQESRRVDEIDGDFHVYAWDEEAKQRVVSTALRPFQKPAQDLYRIQLSDGTAFHCSPAHRILTQKQWSSVSELSETSLVSAPTVEAASSSKNLPRGFYASRSLSIWDIDLSASPQDVRRWWKTLGGLKCHYSAYLHHGDGQPLCLINTAQDAPRRLCDAQECISYACERLGGSGNKPLYIRFYLQSFRPSILDGLRRFAGRCVDTLSRVFCKPCKSASLSREDQEMQTIHLQSAVEFFRQPQSTCESGQLGIRFYYACSHNHYTIPVKSDYLRTDTVWDFTVPGYHNYFIGSAVHHNSSKTTVGARTAVKAAMSNKDALILCFAQDAVASVRVQQKAVYDWLPAEYKKSQRTDKAYIKYSLKNGFTGDSLIFPETNSTIAFHTYSQFLNNPGKFEGVEVGSLECEYTNLGIWLDEYLLGPDLVDTLRFRLATRNSKMILTFTPIDGITEFLSGYMKGADTLESRSAELLGGETVPYIQKARRRNAGIIYFHSDKNPFGGYERLSRDLKERGRDEILTRAYGVPVAMLQGQFPMFKRSVNVMKHEDMMKIVRVDSKVTRYQVIDPGGSKRWSVVWIAVDEDGCWYVYRDWPDKSYGDWATTGANNKSKLSEASKTDGRGIKGYIELFEELEKGEKIYERLIDPRAGANPKQVEEGVITLIQQLEDNGLTVVPAPGGLEDHGMAALNGLMSYNVKGEVDATNRPNFFISDECEQTIDCILNYTASEGPTEAWKDFIDCLRYAAAAEIAHETALTMQVTRQGRGGY